MYRKLGKYGKNENKKGGVQKMSEQEEKEKEELPTAAEIKVDQYGRKAKQTLYGQVLEEGDELVRREDVEKLFRPEKHARNLEYLSRRLQAAASKPIDKEEILIVARQLTDHADEQQKFNEEVQNQ